MKFKRFKKIYLRKILSIFLLITALVFLAFLLKESLARLNFIASNSFSKKIIKTVEPVISEIYFNNASNQQTFSPLIIKEIDRAEKSLEIAVYSFKSLAIKEAVYRASARGVKVTLVLDFRKKGINDVLFLDLPPAVKRLNLGQSSTTYSVLMHHKFALIDRGEKNESLIFGSNNWTEIQDEYDQSFLFLTRNHYLVESFGREFDRLNSGESGPAKLDDKLYDSYDLELEAGSFKYSVLFGPSRYRQGINGAIYTLLKDAKKSIKIMIWDFTDKNLAAELVAQAKAGVDVKIIGDSSNIFGKNSVFSYLNDEKKKLKLDNLEILMDASSTPLTVNKIATSSDSNLDPFLHYHMLMIDDKKILFGTNNWSTAGSYFNDESAIMTDDSGIIKKFRQAFDYNYGKRLPAFRAE